MSLEELADAVAYKRQAGGWKGQVQRNIVNAVNKAASVLSPDKIALQLEIIGEEVEVRVKHAPVTGINRLKGRRICRTIVNGEFGPFGFEYIDRKLHNKQAFTSDKIYWIELNKQQQAIFSAPDQKDRFSVPLSVFTKLAHMIDMAEPDHIITYIKAWYLALDEALWAYYHEHMLLNPIPTGRWTDLTGNASGRELRGLRLLKAVQEYGVAEACLRFCVEEYRFPDLTDHAVQLRLLKNNPNRVYARGRVDRLRRIRLPMIADRINTPRPRPDWIDDPVLDAASKAAAERVAERRVRGDTYVEDCLAAEAERAAAKAARAPIERERRNARDRFLRAERKRLESGEALHTDWTLEENKYWIDDTEDDDEYEQAIERGDNLKRKRGRRFNYAIQLEEEAARAEVAKDLDIEVACPR